MQHHTINATHDHSPILIYDTDFGPICSPSHIPDNTLVPVSSIAGALVTSCQSCVHFATCNICQMTCTTCYVGTCSICHVCVGKLGIRTAGSVEHQLHLLLIISSNHRPLCSVHTMIRPLESLVVSLLCCSFHAATTTLSAWPCKVWFAFRPCPLADGVFPAAF